MKMEHFICGKDKQDELRTIDVSNSSSHLWRKKKYTIFAFLMLFCTVVVVAKDIKVDVVQNVAHPGGNYKSGLATARVIYNELTDGTENIRYNFTLDAKKDIDNYFVSMKINFPAGIKYSVTAFDGIAGFEIDEEQVPALLEYETHMECLIPVKKEGKGFVEIQLTIPESYIGDDIPIKVTFDGYNFDVRKIKKEDLKIKDFIVISLAGVLPGGSIIVDGVYAYREMKNIEESVNYYNQAQVEEKFSIIKDKKHSKKISMANSMKKFLIQVR